MGVDGVESFTAMLPRLRFPVALAPLTGVSFGVSGAGAASSRARALVDRRGSDMTTCAIVAGNRVACFALVVRELPVLESDARDGAARRATLALLSDSAAGAPV